MTRRHVQGSAKRLSPGLMKFAAAVAYHFCLALLAIFTQPGAHILAELCIPGRQQSPLLLLLVLPVMVVKRAIRAARGLRPLRPS